MQSRPLSDSNVRAALRLFNISCDPVYMDRYFITKEILGAGSFGRVYTAYRAERPGVWVRIALKEVSFNGTSDTHDVIRRIEDVGREGALTYNAKSRHVVAVYRPWFDEGRAVLCIPQERCDESLETFRTRHRQLGIPSELLHSIFFQCLDALEDLQQAQIVHNDIKPANLMLVWRSGQNSGLPEVKLTDFGLSTPASEITLLTSPNPIGTPLFMAPECYSVLGGMTPHARDMWSMTCVFYQLLTGRYPFTAVTREELKRQVLAVNVTPITYTSTDSPLTVFLCRLVLSLFVFDPVCRPTPIQVKRAMLREVSIPPPPLLRHGFPLTYSRMVVCSTQMQVIIYSKPCAEAQYVTAYFLLRGNNNIFVLRQHAHDKPRRQVRSTEASNFPPPPLFARGRPQNSARQTSPAPQGLQLFSTNAELAPPTWHRVVYPFNGYCLAMSNLGPTLRNFEEPELADDAEPTRVVRYRVAAPYTTAAAPALDVTQLQDESGSDLPTSCSTCLPHSPSPHAPTPYNPKLPQSLLHNLLVQKENG